MVKILISFSCILDYKICSDFAGHFLHNAAS